MRDRAASPGLLQIALGAAALGLCAALLPVLGSGEFSYAGQISAFALAVAPAGLVLHGFASLTRRLSTPRLLILGGGGAVLGFALAFLARPEAFAADAVLPILAFLFSANALRILAAASLGLALARHVSSPGVALLVAGVATASDLFSVFAGPTRALLREESPALDLLLLIFPAFGQPLGFALGVSDFVFLALFAAMSRTLGLRYPLTLSCCLGATLLAMTAALLLERPLPALPFISLSFVLVNADLILDSLRTRT